MLLIPKHGWQPGARAPRGNSRAGADGSRERNDTPASQVLCSTRAVKSPKGGQQ